MKEKQAFSDTPINVEAVAAQIVDAAICVHRALGPGLLESVYQQCLAHELRKRGLEVECEVGIPVVYDDLRIETGYRADMLVNGCVLIENKTLDQLLSVHQAQLLTYLRLGHFKLGFLLNWKVTRMKDGIKRIIL
jgi:GxxExxY protein